VSTVARRCASSIAICDEPISVEWMLHEIITTAGCSLTSRASSAALKPRGSASRACARRISSRRRRFSGDEMVAITIGRPCVVGPRVSTRTRGDAAASAAK
jgi:hypothetical protein